MNGEPLTRHQGSPLRLIVPGWYGVANVKWLSQIHGQEEEYLGKFQARWYRTLKGEMIDGDMKWKETAVTHMQLKSFIARVARNGDAYKALGVVLNVCGSLWVTRLMALLSWIEHAAFPTWVRTTNSLFGYYGFLFLHTVGLAMVVGISSVIDLRVLGFARRLPIAPLDAFFPILW